MLKRLRQLVHGFLRCLGNEATGPAEARVLRVTVCRLHRRLGALQSHSWGSKIKSNSRTQGMFHLSHIYTSEEHACARSYTLHNPTPPQGLGYQTDRLIYTQTDKQQRSVHLPSVPFGR